MQIATIGFTQTTAEHFFARLLAARVERLVDIRLHNTSQLAGFARGADLAYFLRTIGGISYEHDLRLAPTEEMLATYRRDKRHWAEFETGFSALMAARDIPAALDPDPYRRQKTALLCSEATPAHCHRRVLAELLARAWGATIEHL